MESICRKRKKVTEQFSKYWAIFVKNTHDFDPSDPKSESDIFYRFCIFSDIFLQIFSIFRLFTDYFYFHMKSIHRKRKNDTSGKLMKSIYWQFQFEHQIKLSNFFLKWKIAVHGQWCLQSTGPYRTKNLKSKYLEVVQKLGTPFGATEIANNVKCCCITAICVC
jgi:hypothetical protein